jgi:hypothetical protein
MGVSFPAESDLKGGFAVRKKRFSVEQIVGVLKQAEVGVAVVEICPASRNHSNASGSEDQPSLTRGKRKKTRVYLRRMNICPKSI